MTGPGLSDCGPNGNDACARSLLVPGGTFYRGEGTSYPATVSTFRLDKYEVTVGRFRKFVDAWVGGWRPTAGAGKHVHLNGGAGLADTAGGYEAGWDAAWAAYVGARSASAVTPTGPGASAKAEWDTNLSCDDTFPTWTTAVGANEKRPQNCLSWYDLHAFCIWDGGFLPSEAEWEYAAAGGSEERTYAWGNTAPGSNTALAIYGCYYNGSGSCTGVTNIAPVGTVAAGAGKWGQLDLAGNIWEWGLDWYHASCDDCSNLTAAARRVNRGGSFFTGAGSGIPAAQRPSEVPAFGYFLYGGRCARTPSSGTCTAESDAAFCTRLGATCGSKSGTDNCGQARTVANCGTCATGNACGAANTCVCAGGASEPSCCGGTLPSGETCQACGLNTCSAASCDDGTAIAASLANATLDCQYRSGTTSWSRAMSYCEDLGAGWRLPSKGEAARIASSPSVCRISLSGVWGTWTRTCSAAATAWRVSSSGNTVQTNVDNTSLGNTLCVR
jgi:sulfatase modifying factor 1